MAITVVTSIEEQAPGGWPPTGWKPVCILPSCNPGGVGTPTATTISTGNASPSTDGNSMKFSVTGPAFTNALWTYIAAINDPATYFYADFWVQPTANAALAGSFEVDMFNFSITDNKNYMMGTQYNQVSGKWQIWDGASGGSWVDTVVATTGFTAGSWKHVQQVAHRISGDLTHVYYDFVVINGVVSWYSGTPGVSVQKGSDTLPGGWASAVGIQFQVDIGGSGSSGAPVGMNIDEVTFVASPSALTTNAKVDQLIRESLETGTPAARVDQLTREALETGTPSAKVDQLVREAVLVPTPRARVDQVVREAFIALPVIHVDQLVREAWFPISVIRTGKIPITGGAFIDALGNPVAFGTLIMELAQDAMVKTVPGQVAEAITIYLPLDADGNIAGVQLIWPTDQLLPSNLTYKSWVQTSGGAQVWGPHDETVTTPQTGSFDITSNWITPLP